MPIKGKYQQQPWPEEFMGSVAHFTSYRIKHSAHFIHFGPFMCQEDSTKIIKCNFHTISPLVMHLLNEDILLTFIIYPPKVNVLAVNKTACMFKCEPGVRKMLRAVSP